MIKNLAYAGTLSYYDGIQIFEARDAIGGNYIALLVDDSEDGLPAYAIVGVSPFRLQDFRLGKVDLLTIMRERSQGEWFYGPLMPSENGSAQVAAELRADEIPSDYLPDDGLILSFSPDVDVSSVRKEIAAHNRLALEVSLESSSPSDLHLIHAATLSGMLIHIQSLVKYAFQKANAKAAKAERGLASVLDVAVPAIRGSFKFLMVPAEKPNLFKENEVRQALEIVDDLLANTSDPQSTLVHAQKYAGHTAGAFIRLLRFMVEADVSMSYSWGDPSRDELSIRKLSRTDLLPLLDVLSASEKSIAVEKVTVVGRLRKADAETGTWLLLTDEGEKNSGKTRENISLEKLTIGNLYAIDCEEEVEESLGTGREKKTLWATRISSGRQK
ncbi:MAG: hypothetical protein M3O30_12915 [Planctomycetota bacterium]|nr:hypothetical protein [Planctomycetota bacterium]